MDFFKTGTGVLDEITTEESEIPSEMNSNYVTEPHDLSVKNSLVITGDTMHNSGSEACPQIQVHSPMLECT